MDNYLVIDTENNGAQRNKAHPFDQQNKLLLLGAKRKDRSYIFNIEYDDTPYGSSLSAMGELLSNADIIVGFNLKYDLHWINRYLGGEVPSGWMAGGVKRIWDCQAAEFLLSHQTWAYPSLHDAAVLRNVSAKKDILFEYLSQGLDVSDIPLGELSEYLNGDLISTEELFLKQVDLIEKAGLWELMDLQMQDLLVITEMEWNGLKYNVENSLHHAERLLDEETEIINRLNALVNSPVVLNWDSPDQLSAVLYGGKIVHVVKEPVGLYKTGAKIGQVRYRNVPTEITLPRLVEPLEGSELAKPGYWSTAESVLKELKPKGVAKELIELIQKQTKINKLRTTYFEGIPKKFEYFGWEDGIMHGQLNQCVARTGRLSSSNPNLQNMDPAVKVCVESRYA